MSSPYEKSALFIEDNLTIINKEGKEIPFVLNDMQNKFVAEASGKDIILKGRQMGFSSFILGAFTKDFIFTENSLSVVIADIADNAQDLLARVKHYIRSFEQKNNTKVPLKYNSKYELQNAYNNARYIIGTAENTEFGRSKTITNLHMCIEESSKIVLPDGSTKAIKDIQVGDSVIAEDGSTTVVTNKWNTGVKELRRLRLSLSNETIDVSPDHKIRVAGRGYNNRLTDPVWKKAQDVTPNDYVLWAYPKTRSYVKFLTIKQVKNAVHLKSDKTTQIANQKTNSLTLKTDYKLGYLFGYYLAEGHITKNLNKVTFTCHPDEEYYKLFSELLPLKPKVEVSATKHGTRKIVTYYSKELASFINDHVGRVDNKHVPSKFLHQFPKPFLRGMYDGWKDGDGSKTAYDQHSVSIVSVHERIARQMRQLYINLTLTVPALDYKSDRFRGDVQTKDVYIFREHGSAQVRKNGLKSRVGLKYRNVKTRNMTGTHGYMYIKVKSIEDIDEGNTYDIEVAHPSHAFLTVAGVVSNSEAAFYKHFRKLQAGAGSALVPKGRFVIETTANGFNEFKEFYDESVLGETDFKAHFYSSHGFYPAEYIESERKRLGRLFDQEHPETAEIAFITSGELYFDADALRNYLSTVKEPVSHV